MWCLLRKMFGNCLDILLWISDLNCCYTVLVLGIHTLWSLCSCWPSGLLWLVVLSCQHIWGWTNHSLIYFERKWSHSSWTLSHYNYSSLDQAFSSILVYPLISYMCISYKIFYSYYQHQPKWYQNLQWKPLKILPLDFCILAWLLPFSRSPSCFLKKEEDKLCEKNNSRDINVWQFHLESTNSSLPFSVENSRRKDNNVKVNNIFILRPVCYWLRHLHSLRYICLETSNYFRSNLLLLLDKEILMIIVK